MQIPRGSAVGLPVFWYELENRAAERLRVVGWAWSRPGRDLNVVLRSLAWILSGMGNHGMVLRRGVTVRFMY